MKLKEVMDKLDDSDTALIRQEIRKHRGRNIKGLKSKNNPVSDDQPEIKADGEPQLIGQALL